MDYKILVATFLIAVTVLKIWIYSRQWKKYQNRTLPTNLQGIVTQNQFIKSQKYGIQKLSFSMMRTYTQLLQNIFIIYLDILPILWNYSNKIASLQFQSEIASALVFSFLLYIIGQISQLPYDLYMTFVIQQAWGFNKTTGKKYIKDFILKSVVELILQFIMMAGLIYTINWGGQNFYLYAWAFMTVFIFLIQYFYHDLIAPLFNEFTELQKGELKDSIQELATKVNFPLQMIYVIDGSTRSSHSNAYQFGFGKKKRIVLFDTLLDLQKKFSVEQILAIVAHQLGHWYHRHIMKHLVVIEISLMVGFYSFGYFLNNQSLLQAFEFREPSVFISLVLFSYVLSPIQFLLGVFMVVVTRRFEFEADQFSKKQDLASGLKSGLVKMFAQNSGNMDPDEIYSAVTFSHPPLLERLKAL